MKDPINLDGGIPVVSHDGKITRIITTHHEDQYASVLRTYLTEEDTGRFKDGTVLYTTPKALHRLAKALAILSEFGIEVVRIIGEEIETKEVKETNQVMEID